MNNQPRLTPVAAGVKAALYMMREDALREKRLKEILEEEEVQDEQTRQE